MILERAPVVGVTCGQIRQEQQERPPAIGQNQTYLRAVSRAGAVPLLIPFVSDSTRLRTLYGALDGLLLTGGEDLDPARYGETVHEKCGRITPERDETELALARWAIDEGLPLLAICRGIQVLNVALGGTLYQDIQSQIPAAGRHDWYPGISRQHRPHTVAIAPEGRLAEIVGVSTMPVNSLHHQALKDVAAGLVVTARAPDGIIEAVEMPGHPFAVAVQWHPEELAADDPQAQRIFDAFVHAVQR